MSYFLQSGDAFMPAPSRDALLDELPPGNFTVEESQSGFFFKRAENFRAQPKLYGETTKMADRILTSFQDRLVNTGVLLSGLKGSGKSLLGREVSLRAAALGLPTIMVDKPIPGAALASLLGHLSSPAVVFLDEFEKVYPRDDQEALLTLLDGTNAGRHLFIVTVNELQRVVGALVNRPGRLFYHIQFDGLSEDFIREYCEDVLKDKSAVNDLCGVAKFFSTFSFDMLKALAEEMNRYGEDARTAARFLNMAPEAEHNAYAVEVVGSEGEKLTPSYDMFHSSPFGIESYEVMLEDDEGEEEESVFLTRENLHKYDQATGCFIYKGEDWTVTLRPHRSKRAHWTEY